MSKTTDLRVIPLSEIQASPVALREVNRENEEYQNLSHSVGKNGILNAISVRVVTDPATEETFYQIIDGLHRYTAAMDNDLPEIPALILDADDSEVIEVQIVANLNKVDTKPIEYTKQLQRMLSINPTMTVPELAEKISSSSAFVMSRLSLLKLDPSLQKLVNDGEIKLANAYTLAKFPKEHQHEMADSAMTMAPAEFNPLAQTRLKEIKEALRAGRDANKTVTFSATPRLRKLSELKDENENGTNGPRICAASEATTPTDGFALGVAYCLSLDAETVESAEAKWEAARAAKAEEAKKLKAVREAKKRDEAAKKAAEALDDSGMSEEEIQAELDRQAAEAAEAAEAETTLTDE